MNEIIVLGSGTSTGIPMPGCQCSVCKSTNPMNKRFRTSILIKTAQNKTILIDTSPDLRSQLLDNDIRNLDSIIITHDHSDHIHGIDDVRVFCFGLPIRKIPIYTSTETGKNITQRFPYIFRPDKIFPPGKPVKGGGVPMLALSMIDFLGDNKIQSVKIEGETFHFFLLPHSYCQTMCFLHGKFAYLTDCASIPDVIIDKLHQSQLELLIIDCLREKPHNTHLNTEKCFDYIDKIAPKNAGLIHMAHQLDHEYLARIAQKRFNFPVFPLYDGQKIRYT